MVKLKRGLASRWMVFGTLVSAAFVLGATCAAVGAAFGDTPAEIVPPPMGWGSWNSFSNLIDSQIVKTQAKAIVATGLRAAGYRYVLIDEGWWGGKRDAQGKIVVNPRRWPALMPGQVAGNMANIPAYLHRLGLKAGIYTDAGPVGCGEVSPDIGPHEGNSGSLNHYNQDFLQFAKWGYQYVKVDWCGGYGLDLDPAVQYAQIAHAIRRAVRLTHHPLYFSLCEWGKSSPWTWAAGVGGIRADMWRACGDITAPIVAVPQEASRRVSIKNILGNFDHSMYPTGQHTGYYNDLDMMIIGMPGMTLPLDRLHMSLWAISGAPMIVGADVTKLSQGALAVLLNRHAIAIDQDKLGVQCIDAANAGPGLQVWAKPMALPGQRAVVLLNRNPHPAIMELPFRRLGLIPADGASILNVWANRRVHVTAAAKFKVPAENAILLIVDGSSAASHHYRPDTRAGVRGHFGHWLVVRFSHLHGVAHQSYIKIDYTNPSPHSVLARLQVNGQDVTRVLFPSTGITGTAQYVTLEVNLRVHGSNTIRISRRPWDGRIRFKQIRVAAW